MAASTQAVEETPGQALCRTSCRLRDTGHHFQASCSQAFKHWKTNWRILGPGSGSSGTSDTAKSYSLWLTPTVLEHAVQLPRFSVHYKDRTEDSGKTRGGGVGIMVNGRWCSEGNINHLSDLCLPDLEYLALKCRPLYLPREFTLSLIVNVYIPLQANTDTALTILYRDICSFQLPIPDTALIITGTLTK